MLVRRYQVVVRPYAVVGPYVKEIVGGAGIMVLEGFGQRFGRGAMSAAGVGRQEQDLEGSALLLREVVDGLVDLGGGARIIGFGVGGDGLAVSVKMMCC